MTLSVRFANYVVYEMFVDQRKNIVNQSIEKFASDLVADWAETGKLSLRPSEKRRLKQLLAEAIPQFLSQSSSEAVSSLSEKVRQQQKSMCMDAVSAIPESFPGVVSKQRVLNACEFADIQPK